MAIIRKRGLFFFLLSAAVWIAGCGSDKGTSAENGLSSAFPADLAITSPYAASAASSRLAAFDTAGYFSSGEITPQPFLEKKEGLANRLKATSASICGFDINFLASAPPAACYGPTLDYTHHPDGGSGLPNDGTLPPGDLGIWLEKEPGTEQACLAQKINNLVGSIQGQVDLAVNLASAMFCMAKVDGLDTLPAVGEGRDYTATLQSGMEASQTPFTASSATLTHLAAAGDLGECYQTAISGTLSDLSGVSLTVQLNLKHCPENAENSVYKGALWYTVSGTMGNGGNCGSGGPALFATSVIYNRSATGVLNYRMMRAEYCDAAANPFSDKKELRADDLYDPGSNTTGWAGNFNDFALQVNTADGSGSYNFAWQAGAHDGNTRVLQAALAPGAGGLLTGCGYFGFGPPVSTASLSTVAEMICNWAGPGSNHGLNLEKAQRQCVTQDAASGLYGSDAARLAISYAPTNSCAYDGLGTATFGGSGAAIADSLIPLSSIDITAPPLPTNVF